MLPGISGSLISGGYLRQLADETVHDEAVTLRRLHRWWQRVDRRIGPASSARLLLDLAAIPLFETLGFRVLHLETYRDGFVGALTRDGGQCVVLRVTTSTDPHVEWRETVRAGRVAAAEWGVVFSGRRMWIVDARHTWSRRKLEFDLAAVLADDRAGRSVVMLLQGAAHAEGDPGALRQIVQRSDAAGLDVCRSLGDGVLTALQALLAAFDRPLRRHHAIPDDQLLAQAVTVVYRLLFLLFAEARALVPTWHDVYRDAYTIESLGQRLLEGRNTRGLWPAVQAISRLAHAGCRAGDLVVTPFNGRLFSPRHTPLAERSGLPDEPVGTAIRALCARRSGSSRERIAYADLGVEQLGAVYERVLEYQPQRSAGLLTLTRTSHDRKSSASFYTPRAITDFLVRRALYPLVSGRSADEILRLRVLDPAMGSGAFLVAACRYLSHAVVRTEPGSRSLDGDVVEELMATRQAVAQRCLFGVDLNPMAVQLGKLSLWLTTLARDRPLTFLDHHLTVGNSLVGASLLDLTRAPRDVRRGATRADLALPLFDGTEAAHFASSILPDRMRLAFEPDDAPAVVRDKEARLARLAAPGSRLAGWKLAADAWCAAWLTGDRALAGGVYSDLLASVTRGEGSLPAHQTRALLAKVAVTQQAQQMFHWPLEFPEVFFTSQGLVDPDGGFDVVIGNPPWDVLRADIGDQSARTKARGAQAVHRRFFRESGVYRHQGSGHANRYQLFVERALQLTRPGGRIALILPSGFATDQGSAPLRKYVLDSLQIERLLVFDNRRGLFPIHRAIKFVLLIGTRAAGSEHVTGAFRLSDATWLDTLPDDATEDPREARSVSVSRRLIESWDPEHLTLPLVSSREDLELLIASSAAVPHLSDVGGWGVTFGRELNATDDRPHFVAKPHVPEAGLLTIVEGKHVDPFVLYDERSQLAISRERARTLVDPTRTFERTRLAYRDVASATNRVTLIAARLPPGTISTHTLFCCKRALAEDEALVLLALLNSLPANYLVRLHVTTHVTTALMARLPVPKPSADSAEFRELLTLSRSLERTGVAVPDARYARVNAIAARLYGWTPKQYEHVLGTFPLLPAEWRNECLQMFVTASSI